MTSSIREPRHTSGAPTRIERFEPFGGSDQAAPERRRRESRRRRSVRAAGPAARCCSSSSGHISATATSSSAASGAPDSNLAWAAASARPPRRAGSAVSSVARARNAAAAATPPRARARLGRALQLVGHGLVGTRRGMRTVPGAPIGIQLRIGRLGQRAMGVPAVRHARRPVRRRAHQRMPEPHPRTDLDQARGLGRAQPRRPRSRAAQPRARAASRRRSAPPPPAATAGGCRPRTVRAAARSPARCG